MALVFFIIILNPVAEMKHRSEKPDETRARVPDSGGCVGTGRNMQNATHPFRLMELLIPTRSPLHNT
jgi:hypothetical protein